MVHRQIIDNGLPLAGGIGFPIRLPGACLPPRDFFLNIVGTVDVAEVLGTFLIGTTQQDFNISHLDEGIDNTGGFRDDVIHLRQQDLFGAIL